MEKLTDRVAYLMGLAEGMKLDANLPEHKLLLKMLDVLKEFSQEIEALREEQEELADYVDSLDEDLSEVEDVLFDEEEDDDDDETCGCGHHHHRDDEELEGEMEYECPHCGYQTKFDMADFDFEEDYICPQCQKSFFPESDDEDADADEEQDETKDPQDK